MKNCLLSIGQFAERSLPVILSSFSCFAAGSGKKISSDAGASLDIFSLPARASDPVLSRALSVSLPLQFQQPLPRSSVCWRSKKRSFHRPSS